MSDQTQVIGVTPETDEDELVRAFRLGKGWKWRDDDSEEFAFKIEKALNAIGLQNYIQTVVQLIPCTSCGSMEEAIEVEGFAAERARRIIVNCYEDIYGSIEPPDRSLGEALRELFPTDNTRAIKKLRLLIAMMEGSQFHIDSIADFKRRRSSREQMDEVRRWIQAGDERRVHKEDPIDYPGLDAVQIRARVDKCIERLTTVRTITASEFRMWEDAHAMALNLGILKPSRNRSASLANTEQRKKSKTPVGRSKKRRKPKKPIKSS